MILRDLGGLALEAGGRRITGAANQPSRLALLSVIAQKGSRGVSRDQLLALLWPERDRDRARGALNQALYSLRRDLSEVELVLGTSILRLNHELMRSDAVTFEQLLETGELEAAAGLYSGPFMDGVYPDGSAELEHWIEERRGNLARRHAEAVGQLAKAADESGNPGAAAQWWRTLASMDPLDSNAALGLVHALTVSGDRAGALEHAEHHEAMLRAELGMSPDPRLLALMASLRAPTHATPPSLSNVAPAPIVTVRAQAEALVTRIAPAAAGRPKPPVALAVAAGAGLILVVTVAGRGVLRQPALSATHIHAAANSSFIEFQPALSPDGKSVAFIAGPLIGPRRLVVRSAEDVTDGGEVRLGADPGETDWLPSWTPDGEAVRFFACPTPALPMESLDCHWKETGRLGGAIRQLDFPGNSTASWSPDGTRIAYSELDSLFIYSLADRVARLVAIQRVAPRGLHSLAWSPDGHWLAYTNGNPAWREGENVDQASVWMVATAGGAPVPITNARFFGVSPAWLDNHHLLFVSDRDGGRSIYVVEVNSRGPMGVPRAIPGASDAHSISYSEVAHRLAWARYAPRHNIWAFPRTPVQPLSVRDGRHVTDGNQIIETHDVSPDGQWIAFESNRAGDMDIYKAPVSGGPPIRLTDSPGNEFRPRWSPDGSQLAYYGGIGILHLFLVSAAGGSPALLTGYPGTDPIWSPSGNKIAYSRSRAPGTFLITRDSAGLPWQTPSQVGNRTCVPEDWTPSAGGFLCPTLLELRALATGGQFTWKRRLSGPLGARCPGPRYSRDGATVYCLLNPGRRGIYAIPVAGGDPMLVVADDDQNVHLTGDVSVGKDQIFLTVAQVDADVMAMTLSH